LSAEARFGVLVASLIAAAISGVLLSRQSKRFEKAAAAAAADAEDDESIDGDGTGQPSHTTKPTTPTEHPGTLADGTASVEIDFRH
ncbi:MAG: sodium:proton antiporter, partial [Bifidobacterium longum]|nr:sodium:proton antiporter [Bifidobacterium longum]